MLLGQKLGQSYKNHQMGNKMKFFHSMGNKINSIEKNSKKKKKFLKKRMQN